MVAIKNKNKKRELHRYWFRLCAGIYLDNDPKFENDFEERQAWNELKDEILPDYIKKGPGSRPWAFWKYELKMPQPKTRAEEFEVLKELKVLDLDEIQLVEERANYIKNGKKYIDPEL